MGLPRRFKEGEVIMNSKGVVAASAEGYRLGGRLRYGASAGYEEE